MGSVREFPLWLTHGRFEWRLTGVSPGSDSGAGFLAFSFHRLMAPSSEGRRSDPEAGSGASADNSLHPGPSSARPARDSEEALRVLELKAFARDYFPHFLRLPFSPLHDYLFLRRVRKTREPLRKRKGEIDVVLAPRGAAKSTILSQIVPIHALIHQTERYILIVSATHRQSRARLANIRAALRTAGRLAEHYPEIHERWPLNRADALELRGVRIEACSAGAELRGLAFGEWRPTWIILDDIEDSRRIRAPDYRDALFDWLCEVIEHLGDAFTHIDLIGTLLHRDALPVRLAERPDVRHRTFRAIIHEADGQELWRQWRGLVRDAESPEDLERAREFFQARRERMLAGSNVLWPEKEDYYALQLMRATQGEAAFDKEKQNEPRFQDGGIFDLGRIPRFSLIDGAIVLADDPASEGGPEILKLSDLLLYGFLDPVRKADGPGSRRDFACIATVGLHEDGRVFVLDVWLERAAPSRQVLKVFDLHARWRYRRFGVETTAFQHLLMEHLERERVKRRERGEASDLALSAVERNENKRWRILRLEPKVAAGLIHLADDLNEEFIRQLEAFPEARHDDGPDAMEGAIALAVDDRQRQKRVLELTRRPRRRARRF